MSENATAEATPSATTRRDVPDLARDHAGKGRVLETRDGLVIFKPAGSSYELHLAYEPAEGEDLPVGKPLTGVIHVRARKMYTVPSGGNFVTPIMGEPRIVQGRVVASSDRQLLLHTPARVLAELPKTPDAIDLHSGVIEVGGMVNVVCLPGASFVPVI